MRNAIRLVAVLGCTMFFASPSAGETPVYESLSEVKIGRVFFSARQRAELDRRRGNPVVVSTSPASTRVTRSKPASTDAAGFIVRTSGKSRVYRNGDFVEVSSQPEVKFPDDVMVTRKSGEESGAKDDGAD